MLLDGAGLRLNRRDDPAILLDDLSRVRPGRVTVPLIGRHEAEEALWKTGARGGCAGTRRSWGVFSRGGAWAPSPPERATTCRGTSAEPTIGASCSTSGTRAATRGTSSFYPGRASSASSSKGKPRPDPSGRRVLG